MVRVRLGLLGLEALNVCQRGVFQLDQEFLAIVGCHQVHREAHPLGLLAVHTDAQEVEEQFRGHGADHVWAA